MSENLMTFLDDGRRVVQEPSPFLQSPMKIPDYTPEQICVLLLTVTICGVLLLYAVTVAFRGFEGVPKETRESVQGTVGFMLGIVSGFLMHGTTPPKDK